MIERQQGASQLGKLARKAAEQAPLQRPLSKLQAKTSLARSEQRLRDSILSLCYLRFWLRSGVVGPWRICNN
jgi:hypothetical protein